MRNSNFTKKLLFLVSILTIVAMAAIALVIPWSIQTRQIIFVILAPVAVALIITTFVVMYRATWKDFSELRYLICKFFIWMSILAIIMSVSMVFWDEGDAYQKINSAIALFAGAIISLIIPYCVTFFQKKS